MQNKLNGSPMSESCANKTSDETATYSSASHPIRPAMQGAKVQRRGEAAASRQSEQVPLLARSYDERRLRHASAGRRAVASH